MAPLQQFLDRLPGGILPYVAGAVVFLLGLLLLSRLGRRKPGATSGISPELGLDVMALNLDPLASDAVRLEFYGTPVRLVALVMAPLGRSATLPDAAHLPSIVDQLLPGLMSVVQSHRPQFRRWPFQLSASGFTHLLAANVPLPGEGGKGTPWCAAAGRFEAGGQNLLAGLILKAERANTLATIVVQRSGQWLDVLRVREPSP